jgi:hypothetical protein
MRDRCDFYRSTITIENAFIHYTVIISLSQHRRVIAASHAHRSRNSKSHASAEAQGNVVSAICLSKVNPHF